MPVMELLCKQIQSLYYLFKHDYTAGKRNARLPLLYHSMGYLTLPLNFKVEIRKDKNIFLQTQSNINIMFKTKKKKEQKTYQAPPKEVKKGVGIETEISQDRMNILQHMDEIIM